jgi:hypothetical protein
MQVMQGLADVENNSADMMARLCVFSAVTSLGPEVVQGKAPRLEDQMQQVHRVQEHVQDADDVPTTIAALLQCEDLPDRPDFALPLPRAGGEELDNDGKVTGTALEPLATIRHAQTFTDMISLATFTQQWRKSSDQQRCKVYNGV